MVIVFYLSYSYCSHFSNIANFIIKTHGAPAISESRPVIRDLVKNRVDHMTVRLRREKSVNKKKKKIKCRQNII